MARSYHVSCKWEQFDPVTGDLKGRFGDPVGLALEEDWSEVVRAVKGIVRFHSIPSLGVSVWEPIFLVYGDKESYRLVRELRSMIYRSHTYFEEARRNQASLSSDAKVLG
jgi:hypothetical protein